MVRDIDILSRMAKRGLVKVAISITTLDRKIARAMEPRAATPERRLDAIRRLAEAGIPTQVMVAPIIPGLTDHEIERILEAARDAGARDAGYVLLRLPLELKELFREWLATEFPDRAARVINLLRIDARRPRLCVGIRRCASAAPVPTPTRSPPASASALQRLGMNQRRLQLRTDLFSPPVPQGGQMRLL